MSRNPAWIEPLLASYRPGFGLPHDYYADERLYPVELEVFWRRQWLFAGHACQIPKAGDFFVYDVAGVPVIVVRREDGSIAAHHNVCRHRGSLVVGEKSGSVRSFTCPYHQWTYGLDGSLRHCRAMPAEFDRRPWGLKPVALAEVEGLIYICLAGDPPPFDGARECIGPVAKPQGFPRARVAKIADYVIEANWKLVWENNRECFHCNVNHPQYIRANFDHFNSDDTSPELATRIAALAAATERKWAAAGLAPTHASAGMTPFPDADRGIWYSANRTVLVEGWVSETMDGAQKAPLMGDYAAAGDPDVGTVRIRTLPNFWNHSSCDHGVSTRLTPLSPTRTEARVIWVVDAGAVEGRDYRLDDILPFWQLTSEQDWEICERQQVGVMSPAYSPGPLSPAKEYNLDAFLRWYVNMLAAGTR